MAGLTLQGISRRFPGAAAVALDGVSLSVPDGGCLAVLGPSGCGKTTLLRLVAGLDRPDGGRIAIGERVVSAPGVFLPPERRNVGVVFQAYALWPHMTVAENVGYPLKVRGAALGRRSGAVAAALAAVGLAGFGDRRPASLSGGQRQRVALARCLVAEPDLVLLDEPLANLDPHLKASMLEELAQFRERIGATMVYITHDQAEAMTLADNIAILHHGRLLQLGGAADLYDRPRHPFVAGFIGQGSTLPVTVLAVRGGHAEVALGPHVLSARAAPEQREGPALLLLRPHALRPAAEGPPARVVRTAYAGGDRTLTLRLLPPLEGTVRMTLRAGETLAAETLRLGVEDAWVVPTGDDSTAAT